MIIEYIGYDGKLVAVDIGKGYLVIFPSALSHPAIKDQTFIAHKNFSGHGKGWTVTHIQSGAAFARGATKKHAIKMASDLFNRYDNDRIELALSQGIDKFNLAKATSC